ncbi:ACT domain-containing protein ACR6-like [Wolffia australiana]
MDDWYAKLVRRMTTPSFVIDNNACPDATVMKLLCVEATNKQGILLGFVQALADLDLVVVKANMSFDGEWFMDVLHVKDGDGNKVLDRATILKLEEGVAALSACPVPAIEPRLWRLELVGSDRPGLLSDLSAVLRDLQVDVVNAEVWTHDGSAAAVILVTAAEPVKLAALRDLLCNVLRGDGGDPVTARVALAADSAAHPARRLHQLMFSGEKYLAAAAEKYPAAPVHVAVSYCPEKDYTMVTVRSPDRPKLLFDTLCALADLGYLVFHGTVVARGGSDAWQEYYMRHEMGRGMWTAEERRRVECAVAAAIGRRVADGAAVEVRAEDRAGLLCDITRVFRENGLAIRRAQISTAAGRAVDTFHVSDLSGGHVDRNSIDVACRQIRHLGKALVRVKDGSVDPALKGPTESTGFLLGSLLRACSLHSFRPIRSYS